MPEKCGIELERRIEAMVEANNHQKSILKNTPI